MTAQTDPDRHDRAVAVERTTRSDHVVARLRAAGCVYAEDEAALLITHAGSAADLERLVDERCSGVPLEHVVGWADFAGVRVRVDPGVFVPRSRTAFLVECAASLARPADTVIDLCCGTGAVGVAIHARVGGVDLHACDLEPAAVACARHNVLSIGGHVYAGDLDAPLPAALHRRARLVVANAPYVPTVAIGLLPHEARDHEPLRALDGGHDGLDLHRRISTLAGKWLTRNGYLLIETSADQAMRTAALIDAAGFTVTTARSVELDATVVIGSIQDR